MLGITRLFIAGLLCVGIAATTAQAGMRVGVGIGVGGLAIGALGAMSNGGGSRYSEPREYQERKKSRSVRREREEKAPARSTKKSKAEKTDVASITGGSPTALDLKMVGSRLPFDSNMATRKSSGTSAAVGIL